MNYDWFMTVGYQVYDFVHEDKLIDFVGILLKW